MSEKDFEEMGRRIDEGVSQAHERMLRDKALRGESVIICEGDEITRVPARDILDSKF